jgi:ADP-heptose:LPS heptosyltransferase
MNHLIVSLKAFGDFVIACSASRRVQSAMGKVTPTVVAGEHVRNLASALGVDRTIQFIGDDSWSDVPAAFDVRKRGVLSALRSLNNLHQQLDKLPTSMELVFDHLGWRELFIGRGRLLHSLPAESWNIYLAYDRIFELLGYDVLNDVLTARHMINSAVIIPGARMESRKIPPSVISKLAAELEKFSIKACVVVLEGESIDIPSGICVKKIPRSFDGLVATIKSTDLVISADSLPGHLSEFLGKPIFVLTPMPEHTKYWLPRSAYQTNGWATFSDIKPLRSWLDNKL